MATDSSSDEDNDDEGVAADGGRVDLTAHFYKTYWYAYAHTGRVIRLTTADQGWATVPLVLVGPANHPARHLSISSKLALDSLVYSASA